jgi:hypothetical protein
MSLCDKDYPSESAFLYLDSLRSAFLEKFSQKEIEQAIAYSLNQVFKDKLKVQMDYFNQNKSDDSVSQLKRGINDLKNDVLDASGILTQRGDKINLIVKKADMLRQESSAYYKNVKFKFNNRLGKLEVLLNGDGLKLFYMSSYYRLYLRMCYRYLSVVDLTGMAVGVKEIKFIVVNTNSIY